MTMLLRTLLVALLIILPGSTGAQVLGPGTYRLPLETICKVLPSILECLVPEPPDTTPPTVSGVTVSGVTQTSATIAFAVSEPSTTRVGYKVQGSGTLSETLPSALGPGPFSVTLVDLTPDTTYEYQVFARDVAQNNGSSTPGTFKTLPPPPQATLTVVLGGSGQGAVTGTGINCGADCTETVPVGTTVVLTGTPAAGSVGPAWGAGTWLCEGTAVCSVTVMGDMTVPVTFDLAPVPPTTGGPGAWARLSKGTGAYGWYFSHASVEPCGQGRIWHTWENLTYLFDPAAARFVVTPTTNQIGWRENFGSVWDCESNAVWIGSQVSYPGPFDGYVRFDLATMTYAAVPSAGSSMQIQAHDPVTRTLFSFAGWVTTQLKTRPSTDLTTAWTAQPSNPALPAQNQDSARMSQLRGGRNSRTGMLWYIGDNQVLRTRMPGATGWTTVATTGPTPPLNTVFTLHEGSNTIVGFTGCAQVTDPCPSNPPRQTYLLDLATSVWRLGPSGANAPPAQVMAKYIPGYDKVRDRVVLLVPTDERTEVWAWTPEGGGGTVPPPTPVSLTLLVEGPGTISPAGTTQHAAGATVAMTTAPTAGGRWVQSFGSSPACPVYAGSQPITLPQSGALTCTVRYETIPTFTPGPFAAWKLKGDYLDSVGGMSGVPVNGPVTGAQGTTFGTTSAVRVAPNPARSDLFRGGGTVVFCANLSSTPDDARHILSQSDNFRTGAIHWGWGLRRRADGRLHATWAYEVQMAQWWSETPVPHGALTKFAVQYDHTNGTNPAQFFVNDVAVPTILSTVTGSGTPSPGVGNPRYGNDMDLLIGNLGSLDAGFQGTLSDVRFFRGQKLTVAEMQALGGCTAPTIPPPTAGGKFFGKPLPDLVSNQPPRWSFSRGGNTKDVPCVLGPASAPVICGTGDFTGQGNDSGQNVLFSYDPATHQSAILATYCAPTGQISPNHSSDKGAFFYRALNNSIYLSTDIQFPDDKGKPCNVGTPSGSTYTGGLLKFDLTTKSWSLVRSSPLGSLNIGHYDAASDTHLHVRSNSACGGGAIWGYHVASGQHTKLADLCTAPPPSFSSGVRPGYGRANLSHYLQQFAWDPVAQRAYIVLTHPYYHDAGGSTSRRDAFLWQWDRASNQVMLKAKPPVASTVVWSQQGDYSINPVWVPGTGVVWPVITDPCAQVKQVLVYPPDADAWTEQTVVGDVTQDIRGSSQLYIPGHGVMVVGSVFCASGNQQYAFFWR